MHPIYWKDNAPDHSEAKTIIQLSSSLEHDSLPQFSATENNRMFMLHKTDNIIFPVINLHQHAYPVFLPHSWCEDTNFVFPSQEYFNTLFEIHYSLLAEVLPLDNVVVGGSVIAWLLQSATVAHQPDEIDLFIINSSHTDRNSRNELVSTLNLLLDKLWKDGVICETSKGQMILTFPWIKLQSKKCLKVKIILSVYESVISLLHATDIGVCAALYDGLTTYLSEHGVWCTSHKLIVIRPIKPYERYAERLVKYFQKGYGIILQHFRGFETKQIRGNFFHLNVEKWISNFLAKGNMKTIHDTSTDMKLYFSTNPTIVQYSMEHKADMVLRAIRWNTQALRTNSDPCNFRAISLTRYESTILPMIEDCFPQRTEFSKVLTKALQVDVLPTKSQCNNLYWFFGLTNIQILSLCKQGLETQQIAFWDLRSLLNDRKSQILNKYDQLDKDGEIDWMVEPHEQEMSTELEYQQDLKNFYSTQYFTCVPILLSSEQQLTLQQTEFVYLQKSECSLCQTEIPPESRNILHLLCGHLFHYEKTSQCPGIEQWLRTKQQCPNCRGEISNMAEPSNVAIPHFLK